MSRYCPILKRKVVYQICEDCEDKPCRKHKFLSGYKRYHNLIRVADPSRACDLIRQDGWATALSYSGSLKTLILRHGLTVYDRKAIGGKDIDTVAKEVICILRRPSATDAITSGHSAAVTATCL